METRTAIGRGRTLVEDPRLVPRPEPPGLADDVFVAPTLQHALLEAGKVQIRVYGAERHGGNRRRLGEGPIRAAQVRNRIVCRIGKA
jgi:hypothetical protein